MKKCILIFIFSIFSITSFAQDFQSTFQKFNGAYVPDRIHIHFDKTSYAAGDTVWFKAYLVQGILPAEKSKTLYIDWSDKDGKIISRTISPIVAGVTYGQIALPTDYASEFLHVKAYTKWMLNFDSSCLYNNDLRVINPRKAGSTNEKLRILFNLFPEGGNLVAGLRNKIAFKATDQYGRPAVVTGNIMVNGSVGEKIKPIHDGMGYFYLTPKVGDRYTLSWKGPNGTSGTVPFPGIAGQGVVLQVRDSTNNKVFYINSTDQAVKTVHIIGTMYQQAVFNIERNLEQGKAEGIIPAAQLPSGILTITVLDENYHPLSERITFINNDEYRFETEMNVAHWGLNKRAKNEIEITIPDSTVANLSVSVTDNAIDYDTTHSIISDLLLSSELKGKVYNPVFYFTGNPDSTAPMLDLVMLTNGWRKISWTSLAKGELPVIRYPSDSTYETISGKIYGALPSQLSNAGDIILIVNQKNKNEWLTAPIQRDGSFNARDFMLFDTATVYYQPPKKAQLKNITVQFMQDRLAPLPATKSGTGDFIPNPDTTGLSRHSVLSEALQDELKFFKGKVLENITVTARPKTPEETLDQKYASGLFSGSDGRGFDLRTDPSVNAYQSIFDYLQGRVAGVIITPGNPPSVTWRGGSPALFLNEMPVDADMLSNIPVSDIAYVKVLNPPFMGAVGGGGNGAIAVYTRKGGDVETEPGKGLAKNSLTGYSVIRQFYSPDYERISNDQKDLRTTLYWNPEVLFNAKSNKVTLKFFNNDITESFRVVIEGMTQDGKFTRLIQVME